MTAAEMMDEKEPFERITPEQAKGMLESGDFQLIDVREPAEWAQGHLPGARHVPLNTLIAKAQEVLDRDNVIFVCAEGIRSAVACEVAAAVGRSKLFNLEGGTNGWAGMGFPIERDA
ncbi:MAG: rhodanese-like domain-containing protein [Candidatus Methylomirabilales bacterium]